MRNEIGAMRIAMCEMRNNTCETTKETCEMNENEKNGKREK